MRLRVGVDFACWVNVVKPCSDVSKRPIPDIRVAISTRCFALDENVTIFEKLKGRLDGSARNLIMFVTLINPCHRPLDMREAPETRVFHFTGRTNMGTHAEPIKIVNTAVLVDGAFYQKRAKYLFGEKGPDERADELIDYCHRHVGRKKGRFLYRIFYYDCPPSDAVIWNPITKTNVPLARTRLYSWSNDFHRCLCSKRKVAVRMGELLETQEGYTLKSEALKALLNKKKSVEELTTTDLKLDITQKGVDMKMGIDIASLAYGKYVDQIVMIAGDSDFVPAAKLARRNGIDFILDPMWHTISRSLSKHVDGIETCCKKPEWR